MVKYAADKQREKRARRKARGEPLTQKNRPSRAGKPTKFDRTVFIGIDGEGFSEGEAQTWTIGRKQYTGQRHYYAQLASSTGNEVYAPTGRLTTKQCLDFLIDEQQTDANAVLVCFGASYDMTQMLVHDLDRDQIKELLQGSGDEFERKQLDFTLSDGETDHDYRIEVTMRKSLHIYRWAHGADKYAKNDKGRYVRTDHDTAVLWDVWGFFQDSFLGAMRKWIPNDPDYQFITKMKAERSVFDRSEIDTIRRYNHAELRALVAMMEAVHEAIAGMGLKVTRWDGAGAIAAAMMALHEVKDHMKPSPPEVFEAARYAYSGGHIEMMMVGFHKGEVYHYDINSAYPDIFRQLPSLALHSWQHGGHEAPNCNSVHAGEPPAGFTVVQVIYEFPDGQPFYPLFYREETGSILYPSSGQGWYWYPEYAAAVAYAKRLGGSIRVLQWWHMPQSGPSPFVWIEEYFERRKQLVEEEKRSGIPNGEQMMLKLGYNSCYGKVCQQVGARVRDGQIQPPAYFQLEWGGFVTAGCRAKLMLAAIQQPDAIISMATDGIFSTKPLKLYAPKEKILGAWEAQEHDGMIAVMPGVYYLLDGEKVKHYSRGFDKSFMSDEQIILQAWKDKVTHLEIPMTRFITAGSAITSDHFWDMRGMFVECERTLALDGDNSKRQPMDGRKRPHKGLVPVAPKIRNDCLLGPDEVFNLSYCYDITWLGAEAGEPSDDWADDVDAAFLA